MAIHKFIKDSDIGTGLSIVANKLVTDINPQVVNDLVTLSGLAANSTDLGTFTGTLVPDAQNVKQAIQALETAIESQNIEGQYAGTAATFAALPTTTSDGNAVNNSDWAILSADDGTNQSGIYVFDGTNYALAKEIPEIFTLVVETADSDTITLTGDGNTGTELTAELVIDSVITDNLLKKTTDGAKVDLADVKAGLTFAEEVQDLAGNTIGFISPTTNIA